MSGGDPELAASAGRPHDVGRGDAGGGGAQPLLRLRGLSRRFGDLLAVDGLELEVGRGELFGLVGPDGAGKTTTLRMLAGVLRPSAGDAELDGVSIGRAPERAKRRLAYMSQRFGLYADLTVSENLRFYADLFRVPRQDLPARLERLFAFSGLAPFAGRLAGQLSGGMKQKLGLSCALVHEPALLLLDEPTFGVDPVSRRELWRIVHERVAEGVTAVVSTAYLDEAERFDRVALLEGGRLLALDTPAALQASLAGAVLEAHTEQPRRARAVLLAAGVAREATMYGDRLRLLLVEPAERALPAIRAALAAAGLAAELTPAAPSLEDVFIARVTARGGSAAPAA